MATPRRTSRVGSVSDILSSALSSASSPDPLNASTESAAWPSSRRVTRSISRSQDRRSFVSLGRNTSPRKQTFHLDVGGGTKTPSKLRVTVETETPELSQQSLEDSKDVKRTLFNATPTPKRKRASSATKTTTVPLRDADAPGAITPKRRGRPPRAPTPMKQTPGNKRTKLSPTLEEEAEVVGRHTPKPNTRKTSKTAGTPKPKGTPGRKRKAPFVPQETITYASPSPPKRPRTSTSPASDAGPDIGPDFGPDDASVASSDFHNEPAENTTAQEDFSMIVADSIYSLRESVRQEETQELGEATSLIIENALEELRQSRGEGHQQAPPQVDQTKVEEEVDPDTTMMDETHVENHGESVAASVDEPLVEGAGQTVASSLEESLVEGQDQALATSVDEPHVEGEDDVVAASVDDLPIDEVDLVVASLDGPAVEDARDHVAPQVEESSDEEEPTPVSSPVSETQAEPQAVSTTAIIADEVTQVADPEPTPSPNEPSVGVEAASSPSPVNNEGADQGPSEGDSSDDEAQAEELAPSRSFGLRYEDFSSSVATKRRSSPRAMSSPIRLVKDLDVYEDSFSEIPQEILDAAAPSGNWPPEHHQNDSLTPPRLAPPVATTELGARPSLSPIVRVGRALQSVTSDDASPQARQNSLGSPFRPTRTSTPVQREEASSLPAPQAEPEDDDIWAIEAERASNGSLGQATPDKDNNPASELSEYSMLASATIPRQPERRGILQSIDPGNKRGGDMADFFSSPALLPGAENAQAVLERKRLEITQQKEAQAKKQPYVMPTSTMFPSEHRQLGPQFNSPLNTTSSRLGGYDSEPSPAPTPNKVDPAVLATAERNRAVHQGKMAFRGSLAKAKNLHAASGNKGPLPPFAVDLSGVQFPKAFNAPSGTDYSKFMTSEELERWSRDPANFMSSSPTARLRWRSEPNRFASPTKSCLRSPTKPHTPGPRLQWGSDVLSPEAQAQKRIEKRTKEQFLNDFHENLYNTEFHEEFASSSPAREGEPEIQRTTQSVSANEIQDIEMMDVDQVAAPAQRDEGARPAATETPEEEEKEEEWVDPEWRYLRELFAVRSKGQFPIGFIPADFEPRSHKFLGLRVCTHGESIVFNAWHISIIDAFMATGPWERSEEDVARKVAVLAIHNQLRRERRDPKEPYQHRLEEQAAV